MTNKRSVGRPLNPVLQKHPMGCAVACVAFVLGISYDKAHRLFRKRAGAWTSGYYCSEIVSALKRQKKAARRYQWRELSANSPRPIIPVGSIVFVAANRRYPSGHFVVKIAANSYMNPWINFPLMDGSAAGFESKLPGRATFVVASTDL